MSTKTRIVEYLRNHGRCSGSELERQAEAWFTKPSVISRRARELANEGVIQHEYVRHGKQKTVQYGLTPRLSVDEANAFLKSLDNEQLSL